MALIDLEELKYYIGCNQDRTYFYDMAHGKICGIEDIALQLSIDRRELIENSFYYGYAPLPCLAITESFDAFIVSLNNKKIEQYFKNVEKDDPLTYWLAFDKIFHVGFERRLWDEYYEKYVHQKALDWCKEYSFPYR